MQQKALRARDEAVETDGPDDDPDDDVDVWQPARDLREKRAYDALSWRSVVDGEIGKIAAQPEGFGLIPSGAGTNASLPVDQWKAKAGVVEVRCMEKGMFRIVSGQSTTLFAEPCSKPVVSADGKWALASIYNDDEGRKLYRINLTTKAKTAIEDTSYYTAPMFFIPSINKFLVSNSYDEDDPASAATKWNEVSADLEANQLEFIDPVTGKVSDATGEVRPLAQQTFRPLQKATTAGTFWAAIPDKAKNQTSVGIYDAKTLTFRELLTVPKIKFNSMSMWVDEPSNSVYFVYRGHLLKLPLNGNNIPLPIR